LRPYTIFTAADAAGGDIHSDMKLGLQIFQCFSKAALFDHVDFVAHSELASIESATIEKDTDAYKMYLDILSNNEYEVKFSNKLLEPLLTSLTQLVTFKLRSYNEQVLANIAAKMSTRAADN
jgi:hypothetical protein